MLAAGTGAGGRLAFHPTGGTHHECRARVRVLLSNDPVFAVQRLLDAGLTRVRRRSRRASWRRVEGRVWDDPRVLLAPSTRMALARDQAGDGTLGGRAVTCRCARDNDTEYAWAGRLVIRSCVSVEPERSWCCSARTGWPAIRCGDAAVNTERWDRLPRADRVGAARGDPRGGGYNPWTTARLWAGMWGLLAGNTSAAHCRTRAGDLSSSTAIWSR